MCCRFPVKAAPAVPAADATKRRSANTIQGSHDAMTQHKTTESKVIQSKTARGKTAQSPLLLRRLLRARDRMDSAPHEQWPVQRLAQASAVSVAYFAREFKKAFGLPPHRYLLTRRIERATALLRSTELPVTEIALQTGWTSLGTFGRIFRDITGASPGELRARERALAPALQDGPHMPECVFRNAQRPDLTIAVLEKRRIKAAGTL